MPQYILLIYRPEADPPPGEAIATAAWGDYTQSLIDAGVHEHGAALQGVETATTVRVRGGETQIVDGPFAETKEYLAGYYLIECPDLDTALAHAARIPNIRYGSTEVRPVMATPASAGSGDAAQAASQ